MRKILAILLAALMLASLVACGDTTTSSDGGSSTVTGLGPDGPVETPIEGNTAILYNKQSSSYDAQAEAMRQQILDTPDSDLQPTDGGSVYYISATKGNDANNGSKAAPWQTTKNLKNGNAIPGGSVVLFERGGVYRNVSLRLAKGVSLGAYGEGPKPQLLGGDKSYADESLWTQTSTANVWSATISEVKPLHGESSNVTPSGADIGNIIFDNGVKTASEGKQLSLNKLQKDYDFYFDPTNSTVYLYLSKGNPASVHIAIEMAPNKHILKVSSDNHVIENLCLKYTGGHGISCSGANNVTVRGCEIGYIGGARLTNGVRYGNGVELFSSTSNCLVENNWIYQCFDAGYTNQGTGMQKDLTVRKNLIEYCIYNIEIWTHEGSKGEVLTNCTYADNVLRFAGYGFGSYQRMNSSNEAANIFTYTNLQLPCENTVISGNVFDGSTHELIKINYPNDAQGRGPTVSNNTSIK